jgi:ribose transport system ATP-binding protein
VSLAESTGPLARPDLGVRFHGIAKTYGSARVLDLDHLELRAGEVVGLVGENGAGKSTFMGVLAGTVTPDPGGRIDLDGEPLPLGSPRAAQDRGVAMVAQEFPLVGQIDVAENLLLGRRPGHRRLRYDFREAATQARAMLAEVGVTDIDVHAKVSSLSVPARQMIEIAKAVGRRPRLLILDEPTSALGPIEADRVIAVARSYAAQGAVVLFIGHRLDEVRQAADRVVVLRNGRLVADMPVADADDATLVRAMVGAEHLVEVNTGRQAPADAPVLLRAEGLRADRLGPIDLEVRAGEIVGVAGLMGSGRSRLLHVLFGSIPATGGRMTLAGENYQPRRPADAVSRGMALVPEDRKQQSILANAPIRWNITLSTLKQLSNHSVVSRRGERRRAEELVASSRVRCRSIEQPIRSLSGGNQQRAIFGRWFAAEPKLLLLDEPTRGVDVGAKAEIYHLIDAARARGLAVIVASSEMEELFGLAHRLVVMRNGRIGDEIPGSAFSKERVLRAAAGVGDTA